MTAEVTVLNQQAVALAADSAVTISTGKKQKVFNSVNKLFRLSLNQPVGIMVYGAASLFSVPWETIIKLYRQEKKDHAYGTLNEYSHCFLKFLTCNGYEFFPQTIQDEYIERIADTLATDVRDYVVRSIEEFFNIKTPTDREIKTFASDAIVDFCNKIKAFDDSRNQITVKEILDLYSVMIEEKVKKCFEKFTLYKKDQDLIVKSIALYFTKNHFSEAVSGIVFAGFGGKEFFPSLNAFKIDAIINNKPRFVDDRQATITFDNRAQIRRFAQGDMVSTFIEGIDPMQKFQIESYINEIFSNYPQIVIDKLSTTLELADKDKETILKELFKSTEALFSQFSSDLAMITIFSWVV